MLGQVCDARILHFFAQAHCKEAAIGSIRGSHSAKSCGKFLLFRIHKIQESFYFLCIENIPLKDNYFRKENFLSDMKRIIHVDQRLEKASPTSPGAGLVYEVCPIWTNVFLNCAQ